MFRLIEKRLGGSLQGITTVAHLTFLGFLIMASNAIGLTIGRSLFLAKAGPKYLPLFLILMPLATMLVSGGFSRIIDRCDRPKLFQWALGICSLVILGLRSLLSWHIIAVYFSLLIFAWVAYVLLFRIKFWTLVGDYFTSLELKRYTPILSLGSSIGYFLGSMLVGLLSKFITLENQLIIMAVLYGIGIAEIYSLQKREKPIQKKASETSLQEKNHHHLENLPQIIANYPITFYVVITAFTLEIVRSINEVQHSIIYTETFPNAQNLASFLGLVTAALTALELILIVCCTRPLIQKLGVRQMNLIYPLANLLTFIGLAVSFKLPSAIAANFTYRTLLYSIGIPVTALNYNAVPPQLSGRIRVLSEGIFTPMGRILAGVILLVAQPMLTNLQISWLGIIISTILIVISYYLGKSYLKSLVAMLRNGQVNLDYVKTGIQHIRYPSIDQVRALLSSENQNAKLLGLQLAVYLKNIRQIFPELEALLPNADAATRRALIRLTTQTHNPALIHKFEQLLDSPNPAIRSIALEILVASGYGVKDEQLSSLLADENQEVKAIACVAATSQGTSPETEAVCELLWHSESETTPAQAAVRTVLSRYSRQPEFISQLEKILRGAAPEVRRETLETLATIAQPHDRLIGKIAIAQVNHPSPEVRGAAFSLLGVVHCPEMLSYIARGLEDADPNVRHQAAIALAAYGDSSLAIVQPYLSASQPEVVDAAIAAIAKVGSNQAEAILWDYLSADFQLVTQSLRWQEEIPWGQPDLKFFFAAIEDYHQRILNRLFYILSCFGHSRTVSYVQKRLNSPDQRERANAVETLVSLPQRRFVLPIMPLLERLAADQITHPQTSVDFAPVSPLNETQRQLLQAASQAGDRWIKLAASFALATQPTNHKSSRELLLPGLFSQPILPVFTEQLLLLKQIALFRHLNLDQLSLIARKMVPQNFQAGEIIFTEGSLGDILYVITSGTVKIIRQSLNSPPQEIAKLSVGEYFGEMNLLDDLPHTATVIAETDCTLLALQKNSFDQVIQQHPQILLEISKELSLRLRAANELTNFS